MLKASGLTRAREVGGVVQLPSREPLALVGWVLLHWIVVYLDLCCGHPTVVQACG